MLEEIFEIIENTKLTNDVYKMRIKGNTDAIKHSGEFLELKLDSKFLRRPFSINDYDENSITILYKILGQGTKEMTKYEIGKKVNAIIGLGNGFDENKSKKPLLIGGGIGIAPLYNLGKKFNELGINPTFILGFKNKDEIFYLEEFKSLGKVIVTTDDGTFGYKGNAVSYLKENNLDFDYYYACGPLVMLKYLSLYNANGDLSLEARMGCGFGACMGCSIETKDGVKRVCKEGPVFSAKEVKF